MYLKFLFVFIKDTLDDNIEVTCTLYLPSHGKVVCGRSNGCIVLIDSITTSIAELLQHQNNQKGLFIQFIFLYSLLIFFMKKIIKNILVVNLVYFYYTQEQCISPKSLHQVVNINNSLSAYVKDLRNLRKIIELYF